MLQDLARGRARRRFRAACDSLYYASKRRHVAHVAARNSPCAARTASRCDWLEADAVRARYGIEAPGAILSDLAARVDPYRMTYRLLARLQKRGGAHPRPHHGRAASSPRRAA